MMGLTQPHDDVIKWNIFRVTGPCAGNSPVTGEFSSQRPVMRGFEIFFDLRLNTRLCQQLRLRWFETSSHSLWRHCDVLNYSSCFTESQLWFDLDIYLFIYLCIDLVFHYLFISAEAESGVLEKTLRYATGLRELPPLGINPRPSLAFRHPDYFESEDASKEYPIANTCANVLHLPIISRYDTFKERVLAALTVVVFTNEWLSLPCHSYCCLYVLPNCTVLIQPWSCLKKKMCYIFSPKYHVCSAGGIFPRCRT